MVVPTNPAPTNPSARDAGEPPPPEFPALKLRALLQRQKAQGHHQRPTHGENEYVGEVHIVKIEQTKVTVEWQGQTKELKSETSRLGDRKGSRERRLE